MTIIDREYFQSMFMASMTDGDDSERKKKLTNKIILHYLLRSFIIQKYVVLFSKKVALFYSLIYVLNSVTFLLDSAIYVRPLCPKKA